MTPKICSTSPDSNAGLPPWIEVIRSTGGPLAYIIHGGQLPDRTTFFTPPQFKQQVGYVVYPPGGEVQRHLHLPLERHLVGTSEVLLLLEGRAHFDVYDDARNLIAVREVRQGDVLLMVGGGHGFRMIEHTVFLEIKQGPYLDTEEKQRF